MAEIRELGVTPHVAPNTNGRRSEIDGRTMLRRGYAITLRFRQQAEETFGWTKAIAGGGARRSIAEPPRVNSQVTFALAPDIPACWSRRAS